MSSPGTTASRKAAYILLAALALIAHLTVQPGDTLSGIAASHGVSLSALETANPQITDPDLIFAGQTVNLPGTDTVVHSNGESDSGTPAGSSSQPPSSGSSASSSPSGSASPASSLAPVHHSSSGLGGGTSSGGLSSIPGVPSSFAKCVAWHESGNGSNQAYNGGVYGIITASGINVNGQSIGAQKAAFSKLYAQYGSKPWRGDGCA